MNLRSIVSAALIALSGFGTLTSAQSNSPARNRTFTLTAFNSTNPAIYGKPILISPATGIGSVEVNLPPGSNAVPLTAFIYNRNIFRPCSTSPTGACIGMLSKQYAGALTGWSFDFSNDETPQTLGPTPPIISTFGVLDDYEYPNPTSYKTSKPTKVKALAHDLSTDGKEGETTWSACDLGGAGTGPTSGYWFNSIPVPTDAFNGPECSKNWNVKFRVTYTN